MRSVSSTDSIAMVATWPSRHEAPATGRYRIELELSAFNPSEGKDVLCRVYAVDSVQAPSQNSKELRQLGEFAIRHDLPERYVFEARLEKGETIALLASANASLKKIEISYQSTCESYFRRNQNLRRRLRRRMIWTWGTDEVRSRRGKIGLGAV